MEQNTVKPTYSQHELRELLLLADCMEDMMRIAYIFVQEKKRYNLVFCLRFADKFKTKLDQMKV